MSFKALVSVLVWGPLKVVSECDGNLAVEGSGTYETTGIYQAILVSGTWY